MPVGENAIKIQSQMQRYDSGKYRWWECGSLGFESSGGGGVGAALKNSPLNHSTSSPESPLVTV